MGGERADGRTSVRGMSQMKKMRARPLDSENMGRGATGRTALSDRPDGHCLGDQRAPGNSVCYANRSAHTPHGQGMDAPTRMGHLPAHHERATQHSRHDATHATAARRHTSSEQHSSGTTEQHTGAPTSGATTTQDSWQPLSKTGVGAAPELRPGERAPRKQQWGEGRATSRAANEAADPWREVGVRRLPNEA